MATTIFAKKLHHRCLTRSSEDTPNLMKKAFWADNDLTIKLLQLFASLRFEP